MSKMTTDFRPGDRVIFNEFTGSTEAGTVSTTNGTYVFVRYDADVRKHGWDGTTGKSHRPEQLTRIPGPAPHDFARQMRQAQDGDPEGGHRAMDYLMEALLREFGYEEAMDFYAKSPKWYA